MKPWVPKGWTGQLLIIGEAPGEDEDEHSHRPFTGAAGKLLQALWRGAGYTDVEVALVNAVRCRPVDNATPTMRQVRACRPFLLRVIERLAPREILGVGGTALRALTNHGDANVTKARGRNLVVPGLYASGDVDGVVAPHVRITYHPAAVLRGATHLKKEILHDLEMARKAPDMAPRPGTGAVVGSNLGVDTEYGATGDLLTVAFANDLHTRALETTEETWKQIASSYLDQATWLTGHSITGDIRKLAESGLLRDCSHATAWITGKRALCSLLITRMVNENRLSYALEPLCLSLFPMEPWKLESDALLRKTHDMSLVPPSVRTERCRMDAWASRKVAQEEYPKLNPHLVEFTHRIAHTLDRLSLAGAVVDLNRFGDYARTIGNRYTQLTDQLTKEAHIAGMAEFVPTNDHHIRALLYEHLGLDPPRKTKKDRLPAVDKASLKMLDHPVASLLREFSAVDKTKSVSIDGLRELFLPFSPERALLQFNFNPLGARTGRRSSQRPNSQNWPVEVRQLICSRYVGGSIGEFDYRKLEPRLVAWIAGDEKLLHDFTGDRGYLDVARRLLGRGEIVDGSSEYRAIKSIVLGVHYNMQTPKMARTLWDLGIRFSADYEAHKKETGRLRRLYLNTYPGLRRYMEDCEGTLLRDQTSVSLTGRVRHLPLISGRTTQGFGHLLNQAINFKVQSLASDITGSALLDCENELLAYHGLSYSDFYHLLIDYRKNLLTNAQNRGIITPTINLSLLFNECHDSLLIDMPKEHVKAHTELMVETMRQVPSLRKLVSRLGRAFEVPLDVDTKVGSMWGLKAA